MGWWVPEAQRHRQCYNLPMNSDQTTRTIASSRSDPRSGSDKDLYRPKMIVWSSAIIHERIPGRLKLKIFQHWNSGIIIQILIKQWILTWDSISNFWKEFQTAIILQMAADIFFSMIKHQCFFLARGDSSFLALRRVKGKKITRMSHLAFYCSLLLAHLDLDEILR